MLPINRASVSPEGLWTLVVCTRVLACDMWVWRNGTIPRYQFLPLGMHVFTKGMDRPTLLGHMHTAA